MSVFHDFELLRWVQFNCSLCVNFLDQTTALISLWELWDTNQNGLNVHLVSIRWHRLHLLIINWKAFKTSCTRLPFTGLERSLWSSIISVTMGFVWLNNSQIDFNDNNKPHLPAFQQTWPARHIYPLTQTRSIATGKRGLPQPDIQSLHPQKITTATTTIIKYNNTFYKAPFLTRAHRASQWLTTFIIQNRPTQIPQTHWVKQVI